MKRAEEIVRAVASIIKKRDVQFRRIDVREELGLSYDEWMSGYTAIFQGMRIDHPGGAPKVGSEFEGVFRRVDHGVYVFTDYGKKLIKKYDSSARAPG